MLRKTTKKIAEQQKQLESNEKQIAELQATLKLKDDFYKRQEEHLQGMMKQERIIQEDISNITTGASSSGNNADMEKEQMTRKIGILKMILLSKDRVIRWQKQVIQEVREHRRRSDKAADEMKVTIGALERLLQEKDRHNGTQDGETKERKGSKKIFTKRTEGIGKFARLRRIRRMGKKEHWVTVTQAAAQRSQHGEQKRWQTTSTPKRRYSHPQCRTRPTTREEKQRTKQQITSHRQYRQENSTQHYRPNTPVGDNRKLTQLSILN